MAIYEEDLTEEGKLTLRVICRERIEITGSLFDAFKQFIKPEKRCNYRE